MDGMDDTDMELPPPRILVIGIGGMGCALLSGLYREKVRGIQTLAIDTDASGLIRCHAGARVLLESPKCDGMGWGRVGDSVRKAEFARTMILERCVGADVVLICAGLGRATGSGAAPVVAEIARRTGALVVGLVTMPFTICGETERVVAHQARDRLLEVTDSLMVFANDQCLVPLRPDLLRMRNPYHPWDSIRLDAMKEMIIRPVLHHSLNQSCLRRIFSGGGTAVLMHGDGAPTDDMYTLLRNCTDFSCRDVAITGGTGAIVLLFGEEPVPVTAADETAIRRALDLADDAAVICEWRRQEKWVGDDIWVMCLVTGLREPADGNDPWTVVRDGRTGGEGF